MIVFYAHIFLNLIIASCGDEKEFICVYTENPVVVDAKLDEWGNAFSLTIQDEVKRTDNRVSVYTMWDEENLYFAFDVQDTNLAAKQVVKDHPELYLDDMVEFLLDPLNDKDSCWAQDDIIYHINLLGQKKDDRGSGKCSTNPEWDGNARYAIRMDGSINDPTDIDRGYVVEVSVLWSELQIKPFAGLSIGVNLASGDNGILFDWVNASPFRSPYAFGNLILARPGR